MTYTIEEWEWMRTRLLPECTAKFRYLGTPSIEYTFVINSDRKTARFLAPGTNRYWHITASSSLSNGPWEVHDFCWPDGSAIIPFEEPSNSCFNPVLLKIKQLDVRFKNKALPKCKQKALPFPA